MKKILIIIGVVLLFYCYGCSNEPAEQQGSIIPPVSNERLSDMEALRKEYFEFAIENRLDYVPLFEEGETPTQSQEYLYYAFIINLDNWGDDKGIMTKDYVEQVIQTHFEADSITHGPMERGWDYDGEKYIAYPSGVNEEPIYVLKTYDTYIQDQLTIFEITMDQCSFGGVIPTPDDMHNIKKSIVSGDLSALATLQTERFQYYLDPATDAVVFISHTLTTPLTAEELEYFNGDEFFNGEYMNIRNQFLSSLYDVPEKVNLFNLFYCGSGLEETLTEEEKTAVLGDREPICPYTKISRANMDAVLTKHMGIPLADTEKIGLEKFTYLEEYDAYYVFHGDTNYRAGVSFMGGERDGNIIRLFYDDRFMGDGKKVLTLKEQDGAYIFVSNQKTT